MLPPSRTASRGWLGGGGGRRPHLGHQCFGTHREDAASGAADALVQQHVVPAQGGSGSMLSAALNAVGGSAGTKGGGMACLWGKVL